LHILVKIAKYNASQSTRSLFENSIRKFVFYLRSVNYEWRFCTR